MSKLFSILIFLLTYTTTVTANACVEVYPACYNSATMVKYDNNTSVSSINLGTQVTGANIFINGNFIIDQDFEFLNCQIHVTTGGSITVNADKVLKLTNTNIVGCDFMWQGVLLEETAKLFMTANSKIGDAANGVWATKNNYLEISNSIIASCITGVRIQDPNPIYPLNYTTTSGFIAGTQILMTGNMLPPYNGQPLHGYKPYASVFIDNNILFRVGNNAALTNLFQHGTFGVYATNSIVKITNTEFAFIQPSSYYNGKYAAAVTGYGTANGNLCSITVSPLANKLLPNIHDCTIGIWANNANVYAIENFIKNADNGINVTNNNMLKTANIFSNKIEARKFGLWFAYNAGAKSNHAEGNIITVSNNVNGVCISMMEGFKNISGSYNIAGNTLNLQNAIGGIVGSLVFKPIINYNIINQTNTLAIPTNSTAIVIDGCDNAMVNCNSIFSNYPSNAMHVSRGMEVSTSVNFNVSCNNIVNENCAIYFGNNCGATNTFKANTFDGCDMGLYLNTTAIIGQQLQKGNKWLNVQGLYNAENQGSSILSRIRVHTNLNTIWHPLNYYSGPPWFQIVSGTPENCNNDCIAQFTNSDDTLLLRRIANDSALTNAFVQENKSMGGQFLFDLLDTNIQLRMSDTLLYSFWLQHKYNTYGILNEEGDKVNEAFNGNSYLMGMMDTTMQLIQFKLDSLILLDNLQAVNVNTNYSQLMAEVKERYIQLQGTLYSIRSSMSNSQNERFSEADSINQMVQPTEVPEYNQTIMQDIMLQASIIGMDSVASRYQDAWAIAQQCPYSGGAAVYQARNFIAYFNDSVVYNDVASCLQQGIYRKGEVAKNYEAIEFDLMPNPATNSVDVIILSPVSTLKKITLRTMLGQTINQWKMDDAKRYTIYINNYLPGIYIVEITDNAGKNEKRKLIIQK